MHTAVGLYFSWIHTRNTELTLCDKHTRSSRSAHPRHCLGSCNKKPDAILKFPALLPETVGPMRDKCTEESLMKSGGTTGAGTDWPIRSEYSLSPKSSSGSQPNIDELLTCIREAEAHSLKRHLRSAKLSRNNQPIIISVEGKIMNKQQKQKTWEILRKETDLNWRYRIRLAEGENWNIRRWT